MMPKRNERRPWIARPDWGVLVAGPDLGDAEVEGKLGALGEGDVGEDVRKAGGPAAHPGGTGRSRTGRRGAAEGVRLVVRPHPDAHLGVLGEAHLTERVPVVLARDVEAERARDSRRVTRVDALRGHRRRSGGGGGAGLDAVEHANAVVEPVVEEEAADPIPTSRVPRWLPGERYWVKLLTEAYLAPEVSPLRISGGSASGPHRARAPCRICRWPTRPGGRCRC